MFEFIFENLCLIFSIMALLNFYLIRSLNPRVFRDPLNIHRVLLKFFHFTRNLRNFPFAVLFKNIDSALGSFSYAQDQPGSDTDLRKNDVILKVQAIRQFNQEKGFA